MMRLCRLDRRVLSGLDTSRLAPRVTVVRHAVSGHQNNSVSNNIEHTEHERCFCLETMSEDGQGWVLNELGQKLIGLARRTPRAACRTTQLLSYKGDMSEGDKAMRCENLDLDLGWEATCRGAEGKKFTGHAKVTMSSRDRHDVVDVAVSVDPHCLQGIPRERERVVADVVYAVKSLDTVIMEQLNDFLWSMEQHNVRPSQTQELEGSSAEESGTI